MTLRDFWTMGIEDAAAWLGWEFKETTRAIPGWHGKTEKVSAADAVRRRIDEYRADLHAEWLKSKWNQFKPKTWTQLVNEALKVEFGITKGACAERVQLAAMLRPDLYQSAAAAKAQDDAEREYARLSWAARMAEPAAMCA